MAACEKCWADAGGNHEAYIRLLESRGDHPCTLKEQAGPYWDENRQRDRRFDDLLWRPELHKEKKVDEQLVNRIAEMSTTIKIELTEDQARKLLQVLEEHQDEGPYGEGWASDALASLRVTVDEQLERQGIAD